MFQLAVISLVLGVIGGAPTNNQYSGTTKFDAESKTQQVLRLPILRRRTDRCDTSLKDQREQLFFTNLKISESGAESALLRILLYISIASL